MQGELECQGKVKLGSLPWEVSERLAQFSGNWLEYAPEENALIVRHVQPIGCPALAAVPCELISLIDSIPPENRKSMPGGVFYVKDRKGQLLRLLVERGEVRIQWPEADYSQPTVVTPESAMRELQPSEARIKGWARFSGAPEKATSLQEFIDGFEGLYPEGSMVAECEQNLVRIEFKDVNVGPQELMAKLYELSEAPESLQAELEIGSFVHGSTDKDFRIEIHDGQMKAMRPSLWKQQ